MSDLNDSVKETATSRILLSDYILLSRDERTKHIDLTKPCDKGLSFKPGKRRILHFLEVVDDLVGKWKQSRVELCHLCECHSLNGYCVNPRHVYLGTCKENAADRPQEYLVESGRRLGALEVTEKTKKKMSESAKARTDDRGAKVKNKEVWLERVKDGHIFWFESGNHAAEILGINRGNLGSVISGKRERAGGYRVHSWGNSP